MKAPSLNNPLLPYKNSNGIVLYLEGNWTGTYYSEEIKNCIKYGYNFENIEGNIFETSPLFNDYILTLFNIKQNSKKGELMYNFSKILMKLLYKN